MTIIIMGVSGSGKTTIGALLSQSLGVPFYDADDFHPQSNIDKMANNQPLNDDDRQPWLENLSNQIIGWKASGGAVLACSALKETYRALLNAGGKEIVWIYLSGSYELIKQRMEERAGHYMKADLLRSQFDALEIPTYGYHINIGESPEIIVENILSNIKEKMRKSNFGVIGLGVMGRSLSLNIAGKGHDLSVYNRATEGEERIVSDFLAQNKHFKNITGFTDLSSFINSLESPRKILLMIKAGKVVDHVLEELIPLLSTDDVVIDGGNSHYEDTERRTKRLAEFQLNFIGTGISGGEEGALKGPSIMPGGSRKSYELVAPILESIAAKDENNLPCCTFIGKGGAGHFVKMIHNGIEYAEMQLLAEAYAILSKQMTYTEIAQTFEKWNKGDLSSYLLEITAHILQKKEGNQYLLDLILDKAGNKGTGSWSSKTALSLGIPNTMMTDAVFARYVSSFKQKRVNLSQKRVFKSENNTIISLETIENAYRFARIINHYQGFEVMREASEAYNWELNFPEIARIWTNGCIIRSAFMQTAIELLKEDNDLFQHDSILEKLHELEPEMQAVLSHGLATRTHLPVLSSAYQYWIAMTSEHLPANLIQAQRDYFGAHTYQRTDSGEAFFHTNW